MIVLFMTNYFSVRDDVTVDSEKYIQQLASEEIAGMIYIFNLYGVV
jgi:hypothetical protein